VGGEDSAWAGRSDPARHGSRLTSGRGITDLRFV